MPFSWLLILFLLLMLRSFSLPSFLYVVGSAATPPPPTVVVISSPIILHHKLNGVVAVLWRWWWPPCALLLLLPFSLPPPSPPLSYQLSSSSAELAGTPAPRRRDVAAIAVASLFCFSCCMYTRRTSSQNLIPIDLEIEATARKQGTKRRQNKKKEAMGGEAPAKFLWEYGIPDTTTGILSSIVRPAVTASYFELKPEFIQFISNDSFSGSPNDCPVSDIDSFLEKCDTMKINNVSDDAIRLRLFPFSLRDKAKEWLRDEGAGSFDTWDKLVKAFLVKFLGQEKTAKVRNELTTFRQTDDESLYESWRRFKRSLVEKISFAARIKGAFCSVFERCNCDGCK
ncbi:uncharacterized protein [Spinacia oleracea]|uniref:Retrotransposon gag domain-containing protein n=1 Tax=Spinacia oleracea TaxID=3562 RepID=A0ABM3RAQ0_SPIOL|nr:uncharacterized protein LOC110799745 [Spinacia oleracea]